jgi:hypothetical protein
LWRERNVGLQGLISDASETKSVRLLTDNNKAMPATLLADYQRWRCGWSIAEGTQLHQANRSLTNPWKQLWTSTVYLIFFSHCISVLD